MTELIQVYKTTVVIVNCFDESAALMNLIHECQRQILNNIDCYVLWFVVQEGTWQLELLPEWLEFTEGGFCGTTDNIDINDDTGIDWQRVYISQTPEEELEHCLNEIRQFCKNVNEKPMSQMKTPVDLLLEELDQEEL